MNDKAIVFRKVQKQFLANGFDPNKYYFTFSPFAIEFTNEDFNFLSGQSLDAAAVRDDYNDKWTFSGLANTINRDKHIWNLLQDEKIFDDNRYGSVLRNALKINSELTDAEKTEYDSAHKILYKDADTGVLEKTDEYKKYSEYQNNIATLNGQVDDKNNERQNIDSSNTEALKTWQTALDKLNEQITQLNADWNVYGFHQKIETALLTISRTNDKGDFITAWSQHLNEFNSLVKENNPTNNIDFLPTFCKPTEIYQYDYAGWKKITIEENELKDLDSEAKNFLGIDTYNSFDTIGVEFTKIEFELLFVEIARGWLRKDLLESKYWKFPDGFGDVLSSGDDSNTGILPSIPSQLVFIKDLKFTPAANVTQPGAGNPAQVNQVKKYLFADLAGLHKAGLQVKTAPVKSQPPKFVVPVSLLKVPPLFFFQPTAVASHAGVVVHDHRTESQATVHPPVERAGYVWVTNHWERKKAGGIVVPPPPSLFNLTLMITDSKNNVLPDIDVHVKSAKSGSTYKGTTDQKGSLTIPGLTPDNYAATIQDDENFEDYAETYLLSADLNKTISLIKRKSPRVKLTLLGVVNYRFAKLPSPLDGATYS